MSKYLITGGNKIRGTLSIKGAKNSILPLMAASLLNENINIIHNVPLIADVYTMIDILESDSSVKDILKEKNISLETDTASLEEIIKKVLLDNEKSVNDYKAGKENALKFLMGMVMKEVKGSFNPKLVNETLIKMCKKM